MSVALAGIVGASILTTPVFVAAGGAGDDEGTGDITINYQSLTKDANDFTNKIGPNNQIINTDFGYAWDDLNFIYVQTVGGGESTLITDGGYKKTKNPEFKSGAWYKGSDSTIEALETTAETDSIALPNISLVDASINNDADVSASYIKEKNLNRSLNDNEGISIKVMSY